MSDLLVDDLLSFVQGVVNLLDLLLDASQLLLGVRDHLVEVLNLVFEMVNYPLFLILGVDLRLQAVSLTKETSLLLVNLVQLSQQFVDLLKVSLGLGAVAVHVGHVQLQSASEQVLAVFELALELTSKSLGVLKLSVELLDLGLESLLLVFSIQVFALVQFGQLELEHILQVGKLVGQSVILQVLLGSPILLLLQSISYVSRHEPQLLLEHTDSLLLLGRSLSQESVLEAQLVVLALSSHVPLVQVDQLLLQLFFFDLDVVTDTLLFFEHVFGLFGLQT